MSAKNIRSFADLENYSHLVSGISVDPLRRWR